MPVHHTNMTNEMMHKEHPDEFGGEIPLSVILGPRMMPFIETCYKASPHRFMFFWFTGIAAMAATLVIACKHRAEMDRRPPSMLKVYYKHVNMFSIVLGVAACTTLFCPRNYLMMKMFQEQMEAIALFSFGNILFLLCAEQVHKTSTPDLEAESLGSLLSLWGALSLTREGAITVNTWSSRVRKLSAFVCIYGLFIFYKSMHNVLEKWNPTAKFISLKLVVVLMAYQEFLVKWEVHKIPASDEVCLGVVGYGEAGKEIQDKSREHFDSMYLVCFEAILVAFLVRRAFPASELKANSGQFAGRALDVDFERMQKSGKDVYDMDSESDSEESSKEPPE